MLLFDCYALLFSVENLGEAAGNYSVEHVLQRTCNSVFKTAEERTHKGHKAEAVNKRGDGTYDTGETFIENVDNSESNKNGRNNGKELHNVVYDDVKRKLLGLFSLGFGSGGFGLVIHNQHSYHKFLEFILYFST